jgi:hypothetical protein
MARDENGSEKFPIFPRKSENGEILQKGNGNFLVETETKNGTTFFRWNMEFRY